MPSINLTDNVGVEVNAELNDDGALSKSEFGDPWGLVAMDQASGRQATAAVRLNSPTLAILRERGV